MQTSHIRLMLHYFTIMMASHEALPSNYITAERRNSNLSVKCKKCRDRRISGQEVPRSYDVRQLILDTVQHITFVFTVWLLLWRRVQCVTPKRWNLPTPLHGVISQTTPTLRMEAACPFEMMVTEYQTTRCHERVPPLHESHLSGS